MPVEYFSGFGVVFLSYPAFTFRSWYYRSLFFTVHVIALKNICEGGW